MPEPLPKFDRPPVAEVVLGVQFNRLIEYSAAHAGWFWRERLGSGFDLAKEAARLEDQLERFGDEVRWVPPGGLLIRPGHQPDRIQIIDSLNDRMVQIQDSRFIYNWRKREAGYPSYGKLLPEFLARLTDFQAFAEKTGLGKLEFNQWEVTYLNQILRGDLWQSPDDWPRLIPSFYVPPRGSGMTFESFNNEWHFVLPSNRGRLHVAASHGRVSPEGPEVLMLTLTARGPVDFTKGLSLSTGLELGHEAIVTTFASMTSPKSHQHWGRTA
jgi:uncharacterized protein (TIGR04255 family)